MFLKRYKAKLCDAYGVENAQKVEDERTRIPTTDVTIVSPPISNLMLT
jgi:hypothetical protein